MTMTMTILVMKLFTMIFVMTSLSLSFYDDFRALIFSLSCADRSIFSKGRRRAISSGY
jgi:hypothetical protein